MQLLSSKSISRDNPFWKRTKAAPQAATLATALDDATLIVSERSGSHQWNDGTSFTCVANIREKRSRRAQVALHYLNLTILLSMFYPQWASTKLTLHQIQQHNNAIKINWLWQQRHASWCCQLDDYDGDRSREATSLRILSNWFMLNVEARNLDGQSD